MTADQRRPLYGLTPVLVPVLLLFSVLIAGGAPAGTAPRGVENRIVKKSIPPMNPAVSPGPAMDPGSHSWKGVGGREDRNLYPVLYYEGRFPVPLNWYRMAQASPVVVSKMKRRVPVKTGKGLIAAVKAAKPGDKILIAPGTYPVKAWAINVRNAGTAEFPIVVAAETLGSVVLEFETTEGFLVDAPFWVFENLDIKGVNPDHNRGHHAFHVVGKGRGLVLRNCRIHEFNSIIKANGTPGKDGRVAYPDHALIENCSFYNSTVRQTAYPVTLIDVVAANGWILRGNLICDFAKGEGNRISYGAFVKGNATGSVFENNLVIGEYRTRGGIRVGLSFGGGGTGVKFARDKELPAEHHGGIMRNNLIMNCNDAGIYLNRSAGTKLYNNTLYKTMGIDIRFKESDAAIVNNLSTGRFKNRDGGKSRLENNIIDPDFRGWFVQPATGNYSLNSDGKGLIDAGRLLPEIFEDICGRPRDNVPDLGALELGAPPCQLMGQP